MKELERWQVKVYYICKNRRNYGDSLVNKVSIETCSQEPRDFSRGRFSDHATYIENLKKLNESLYDAQQKKMSDYVARIQKIISAEKELLEQRKKLIEESKSNYETTVDTVVDFIDKQIQKLKDNNEEISKQIALEKQLEALARAKDQRTMQVYRGDGAGFVWENNEKDVSDAQNSLDDTKRQNDLDAQIAEWDNYRQKWLDTIETYALMQSQSVTDAWLGVGWEADILRKRTDYLAGFTNTYNGYSDELNEKVTGSVAHQILQLNELSKRWGGAIEEINYTQSEYADTLANLKLFESANYEERLGMLTTFVSSSINELERLRQAQNALNGGMGGNGVGGNSSKVSFDPNVDYQALIDKAVKQGADIATLAMLEKQRNAKIDAGYGQGYQKTYNYHQPSTVDISDSSINKLNGAGASGGFIENTASGGGYTMDSNGMVAVQTASGKYTLLPVSTYFDPNQNYQQQLADAKAQAAANPGSGDWGHLEALERMQNSQNIANGQSQNNTYQFTTKQAEEIGTAIGREIIKTPGYASGGKISHTGIARVHGTPARPETVTNFDDTESLLGFAKVAVQTGNNLDALASRLGVGIANLEAFTKSLSSGNNVGALNVTLADSVNKNTNQAAAVASSQPASYVTNVEFSGNIELPNVRNADDFASSVVAMVNSKFKQIQYQR